MKKIVRYWMNGLTILIGDELISFYTFFTIIFAECAFLWSHFSKEVAKPFTIILLLYILNVVVCAFFKGTWENTRTELIASIVYVIIFVALFIIGCTFNVVLSIVLTVIPLVITFVNVFIRSNADEVYYIINNVKVAAFFYIFLRISAIVPYIVLVICVSMFLTISVMAKVLISILYLLLFMPFVSALEDDFATCNIFEIAYDVTWVSTKRFEKDFEEKEEENKKN